ncbi:putative leader peptide [Pseudonocardia kunmingensis]
MPRCVRARCAVRIADVPAALVLVGRIHVDLCRLQAGALCR